MEQQKQRIVVKVGTSTLTHDSGATNLRNMEHLVRVLSDLSGMGHEVILVTSGAIAVGTAKLGLAENHIKTFLLAMTRLGYQREEILDLLRQETSKEGITNGGSGM